MASNLLKAAAPSSSALDETTPLIVAETAGPAAPAGAGYVADTVNGKAQSDDGGDDEDRPLPRTQILLLCLARLVEPIAFFSIFPFIGQMIEGTGAIDERDVGFYSGLIESLFSLTQMTLMILWGWAADRYGRRPVLIISNLGIAVGAAAFGFSTSVWQMILCRCICGLFAGSAVTVRAMFSEHSTPKTQARAFSLYAVAGNLGIFLGPFIGGSLADPVHQYPRVFGHSELFKHYPYALSSITAGACSLITALVCIPFLKETLKKSPSGKAAKPMTIKELLRSPGVTTVLFLYTYNMMLAFAYTAVVPVFWYTSPGLGGYGLSPLLISVFLAIGGLSQALWTLLLFPVWQKRVGTGGVLRVLYVAYPLFFLSTIIPAILIRNGHTVAFYVVGTALAIGGGAIAMTFTGVQLALNDVSPSHQVLGMLNAICLTLTSGVRAVAPACFSSLYAFGVRHQIVWGYFIWILLALLCAVLLIALRYVPERALGCPGDVKQAPTEETIPEERA